MATHGCLVREFHTRAPRVLVPWLVGLLASQSATSQPAPLLPRDPSATRLHRIETPNLLDCAGAQWKALPRSAARPVSLAAGSVDGIVWTPVGPSPIHEKGCCGDYFFDANGRVNSIAMHPSNPNRLYLGSAGGGVWRSDDAGSTWRPLTDSLASLGIGSSHAIAIDPDHPDILYAGTTNFALLAQSQPRPIDLAQSRGILKSTDGGESWIVLGSGEPSGNDGNALATFESTDINTILIDPADTDTLYVAAGRSVLGGLFRSTDAGVTWTKSAQGQRFAESLVLDTSSPVESRVLYAGLNGDGVLKSSDGGQTWTAALTNATPAVIAAGATGFNKVMVALAPTASPPNPKGQILYATVLVGTVGYVFENTDGGEPLSWVPKAAQVVPPSAATRLTGSPFSDMVVDPASPGDGANDTLYWGGFSQYVSNDSGSTFDEIGEINGVHGDHQVWLIVPQPTGPSIIYIGDDGGIWRSIDGGANWTGTTKPGSPATINAGGLQIGTFYALSVKQDATASATLGGMQDSGRGFETGGSATWSGTSNDSMDVVFDKVTTDLAWSIENGCDEDCLLKSTNGGSSFNTLNLSGLIPSGELEIFKNRMAIDPSNGGYLYVGGSQGSVYQTTDAGITFRSLGQPAPGFYVSSLDVAAGDSNRLVIAANPFLVAANAVARHVFAWTNVLAPTPTFQDLSDGLPTRFVTRVAFDPSDPDVVYATLAGFGATTAIRGHVFRRTLDAAGWTDISPPVDVPVNALALDGTTVPTTLYVGTDLGVLRSVDGGASWEVVDDIHLPNAAVSDLDLNLTAGVLRASTWGRGVFELAAAQGPIIAVAQAELAFGEACAGTGADRTIDVSNVGTQPLVIQSVTRLSGSPAFTVLPAPSTPLTLAPGGQTAFTVHFIPSTPGVTESAFIRIATNDPLAPFVDLLASGTLETQPPVISSLAATPAVLSPPSHKMRAVTLQVEVTDNCGTAACHITSITSSEPVEGTGDGDMSPDWEITGALTAKLRAERAGDGPGRTYTLTVECTDSAGNVSSRSTTVTVPHN